jgi:hypothetical protein
MMTEIMVETYGDGNKLISMFHTPCVALDGAINIIEYSWCDRHVIPKQLTKRLIG